MKEKNKNAQQQKEKKMVTNLSICKQIVMLFEKGAPKINEELSKVLQISQDRSCINDILRMYDSHSVINLEAIEELVNLSETIHGLNLEQHTHDMPKLDKPEEFTIAEVNKIVAKYQRLIESREAKGNILSFKLREIDEIAQVLESYERAINGKLNNQIYNYLVEYGTLALKAKLLDVCKFPTKEVSGIKINSDNFIFTDPKNGKEYTVPVEKGGSFGVKGYGYKLIDSISNWRKLGAKANNTGDTYNGERNVEFLSGCDMIKAFTLMDFYFDDHGKFAPAESMSDVKKTVRRYEKNLKKAQKVRKK